MISLDLLKHLIIRLKIFWRPSWAMSCIFCPTNLENARLKDGRTGLWLRPSMQHRGTVMVACLIITMQISVRPTLFSMYVRHLVSLTRLFSKLMPSKWLKSATCQFIMMYWIDIISEKNIYINCE